MRCVIWMIRPDVSSGFPVTHPLNTNEEPSLRMFVSVDLMCASLCVCVRVCVCFVCNSVWLLWMKGGFQWIA